MFASPNSAFSSIAQKGGATVGCSLQALSLAAPRARARDRIPSPWPASELAKRRGLQVKQKRFKKQARKRTGGRNVSMPRVPLRKAAPTAGGCILGPVEIEIVVDWVPPTDPHEEYLAQSKQLEQMQRANYNAYVERSERIEELQRECTKIALRCADVANGYVTPVNQIIHC
jgi:hypothetical protein